MRLKTRLKLIRWRERYYDFWQRWAETNRWDYDDRRWVNIVGSLRSLLYFSVAPLGHLRKYRFNTSRFRRVKGISRTSVRVYPWTKRSRQFIYDYWTSREAQSASEKIERETFLNFIKGAARGKK